MCSLFLFVIGFIDTCGIVSYISIGIKTPVIAISDIAEPTKMSPEIDSGNDDPFVPSTEWQQLKPGQC